MTLASTARGQTTQIFDFKPFSYIRAMHFKFNVKFYVNYEFSKEFLRKLIVYRSIKTEGVSEGVKRRTICVPLKKRKVYACKLYENMERMRKGKQILKEAAW